MTIHIPEHRQAEVVTAAIMGALTAMGVPMDRVSALLEDAAGDAAVLYAEHVENEARERAESEAA